MSDGRPQRTPHRATTWEAHQVTKTQEVYIGGAKIWVVTPMFRGAAWIACVRRGDVASAAAAAVTAPVYSTVRQGQR